MGGKGTDPKEISSRSANVSIFHPAGPINANGIKKKEGADPKGGAINTLDAQESQPSKDQDIFLFYWYESYEQWPGKQTNT
jgi:hypothetical protein